MEVADPSRSIHGQMTGMEARQFNRTPGSGVRRSGNEGRSAGSTSSLRRRRTSDPTTGIRLMQLFNDADDDDDGGSAESPIGLDRALDDWRRRNIRVPTLPDVPPPPHPPTPHLARLLFLGSPMRSAAAEDNVLIMDGVLIDNSGSRMASNIRRSMSFSGPLAIGSPSSSDGSSCGSNGQLTGSSSSSGGSGCGSNTPRLVGLPGSGGGGRCGSNTPRLVGLPGSGGGGRFGSSSQFSPGREEPLRSMMQALRQRFSDVALPNSGLPSTGAPSFQGSPIPPHQFPPSLKLPVFPTAAPRSISSYTDATVSSIGPYASYFTPPRVTITAARPNPSTPQQPETEPVHPPEAAAFSWPPTAEQDASFAQQLYGPSTRGHRRLPVFEDICPEPEE